MTGQHWRVVDGSTPLVREGEATASAEAPERLGSGAVVEQLELKGVRLHFQKVSGDGPETGWVSLTVKGKDLLEKVAPPVAAEPLPEAPQTCLTPVAEGVYEYVQSEPDSEGPNTYSFIYKACKTPELKAKAEDFYGRWQRGELAPCVYRNRMAVVRLQGGGVMVYSPVECLPELEEAVRALGGARAIVLPNSTHAVHGSAWLKAFPEAVVVCVGGTLMAEFLPAFPDAQVCRPGEPMPAKAAEVLRPEEFALEVTDPASYDEIELLHRRSATLLTSDFLYLGSDDRTDRSGWKMLAAEEWRELYFEVFMTKDNTLLPAYRAGLLKSKRVGPAASLERLLAWKPERVLSARGGKVSEGGARGAAKLLEGHWGWCRA